MDEKSAAILQQSKCCTVLNARPSSQHRAKELEYSLLIGHIILNCEWEVIFSK
jgi:hypothetical protein